MKMRVVARFVLRHPYNRRRRVRALLRLAVWWAFRRFGRSPRTIRWVDGRKLIWYPDGVSAGNAWLCHLIEWNDMHFVLDVLRPGDRFIDVGANVGVYSLLASLQPDVEVLAFEPADTAYSLLQEHVALHGLEAQVVLFQTVLGDSNDSVLFTVDRDVTNKIVPEDSPRATRRLQMQLLDDVLASHPTDRPVFLKVDADGSDIRVLRGARELLATSRPTIIVEWTNPEVRTILEPLGYKPYVYDPERRELKPTDWAKGPTTNILAIADLAPIEDRLSGSAGAARVRGVN